MLNKSECIFSNIVARKKAGINILWHSEAWWMMAWLTGCFSVLHTSEAHAADHDTVLLCSQIQVRPPHGLLWPDRLWLHGWRGLQGGRDFAEYLGGGRHSTCVTTCVFWMSSCAVNRCGCWRWTVTQLSIQTVRCWRRSYPELLWRHWVSLLLLLINISLSHFISLCACCRRSSLYLMCICLLIGLWSVIPPKHVFICCHPLDLTLEIFNKCRLGQRILPLASQREFVLLYNGVYPPDLAVACSRSITSNELNHKSPKKTQKTEPRRCKSGIEGRNVPSAPPDSPVNVSASCEGRGGLKSIHCPTTSPLYPSSPSVQTVRNKNPRPRVELKLSKCTLRHHLKAAGAGGHSKTQQNTRILMLLSSPALSEGLSVHESSGTETQLPARAPPPLCQSKQRAEDLSEEVLQEDTKSVVSEMKEELWRCMCKTAVIFESFV